MKEPETDTKKRNRSKVSESENDFSSNKDYSEEQGRKAFNFGISSACKSNSTFSKAESRRVVDTKSTNSSMKFSNANSYNTVNQEIKGHVTANSLDSRWNSDTHSILHTVKINKSKKLTSNERLEGIFKIYNMKNMNSKMQLLRKTTNQKDRVHVTHFQSTDVGENSYNDYDYDNTSVFLSKLEGKSSKFNTSLYGNKSRKNELMSTMTEVEAHMEATPNNSTKKISQKGELSPLKESRLESSCSSFRGAILRHTSTEKKSTGKLHKPRRVIHTYLKRDKFADKEFRPLRDQLLTCKDFKQTQRYVSVDDNHNCSRESADHRLSKIYIRSDRTNIVPKPSNTSYGTPFINKNMARNDYLNQSTSSFPSVKTHL